MTIEEAVLSPHVSDDIPVRLGKALWRVRKDAGLSQVRLAELLDPLLPRSARDDDKPLSQGWISRREGGEPPEARPTQIAAWEQVTGARPGTVYQLAGLVDPDAMTKSVIANDPLLADWQRGALMRLYDDFVEATIRERKTT